MFSMGAGRREDVLAGAHAGALSVVVSSERAPLVVPVWYSYRPGDVVRFSTEPDRVALEAVRRAGRAALAVRAAGGFVSVEGTVVVYEPTDPAEFRRWARWNLGDERGERYYRAAEDDLEQMTTVRLLPRRWRTREYAPALGACR